MTGAHIDKIFAVRLDGELAPISLPETVRPPKGLVVRKLVYAYVRTHDLTHHYALVASDSPRPRGET